MSRRTKLLILLGIILLLILLLFLLFWRPAKKETPTPTPTPDVELPVAPEVPEEPTAVEVEQEERVGTTSIRTLAETFAERYGSYSTEANFANLTDVLVLMSPSLAADTEAFIDSAATPTDAYGVTTRVVSTKILSQDEEAGVASVEVSTQREEARGGSTDTTIKYQTLSLELVKIDGSWFVDSAVWL